MSKRLPITDADHGEAQRRIDRHFAVIRTVLASDDIRYGVMLPSSVHVTITGNSITGERSR